MIIEELDKSSTHQDAQSSPKACLDIFFVHGLCGDAIGTWQKSEETSWPHWLANDFPSCRIYLVSYDSQKLASFLSGEGASIQDLAGAMLDQITSKEKQAPHSLFIAHSLGGLIVKQALRRSSDSPDADTNAVCKSVAGVAFLGTPHLGSQLATRFDFVLRQFKSKQSKQLAYSDDSLIDLNDFFRAWVSRHHTLVRSYYETEKTSGCQVVDKVTANPGVQGCEPVAVQANHIDICKPESKKAPVYTSICKLIRDILKNIPPTGSDETNSDDDKSRTSNLDNQERSVKTDTPIASEASVELAIYTQTADHDRRDLEKKLADAGRSYAFPAARRSKERFHMELQRSIGQSTAVNQYIKLLSDVESRFNRHVMRIIAEDGSVEEIDGAVQRDVIDPCTAENSPRDNNVTAGLVDGALYYLTGNCHLAWDKNG